MPNKHKEYRKPVKAPTISIFIRNEVKQDGQHQEQKQDKKEDNQQGCMAFIKKLCRCSS